VRTAASIAMAPAVPLPYIATLLASRNECLPRSCLKIKMADVTQFLSSLMDGVVNIVT